MLFRSDCNLPESQSTSTSLENNRVLLISAHYTRLPEESALAVLYYIRGATGRTDFRVSTPQLVCYNAAVSLIHPSPRSLLSMGIIVKAIVFPVVMYGGESWTIKKVERRRIDAFELWC